MLSSIVMISFDILSERFSLKRKGLSNAIVASLNKKEDAVHFFVKNHQVLKVNI